MSPEGSVGSKYSSESSKSLSSSSSTLVDTEKTKIFDDQN